MNYDDFFIKHDFKKDENGEQVFLYLNPNQEEFAAELGVLEKDTKIGLREKAISFVKKKFPQLKKASIFIMAGTIMLTIVPFEKASAHEADFNMTYLYFGNSQSYLQQIDRTQNNLNLVSPSYFDLNADGSLKITGQFDKNFVNEMHNRGIKVVPFLSNHWDRNIGRAALENREQLSSQIADFIIKNNLDGVQVDIENVTEIDRNHYTDLVRLLREKLPKEKEVSVAVAANPNGWTKGWHGSYDYKELAKFSSYLMIMAYDESYQGGPEGPVASKNWVERSIQYALKQDIPPEKIVMGIPFYGRYWKEGATNGGEGISNKRVDELLAKYRGTVVFDEKSQSPKATITIREGDTLPVIAGKTLSAGTYHIWYENSESIKAKIDLVHKYNLKGTGSWSLGQENPVIWNDYKVWMTTHDGKVQDVSKPAIVIEENTTDQAKVLYPTYTVNSGDSLWKIATQYGLTIDNLKQYNYLNSDNIQTGQVLYLVPPPTQTPVIPEAQVEAKVEAVKIEPPKTNTAPVPTPPSTVKPATGASTVKPVTPVKPATTAPKTVTPAKPVLAPLKSQSLKFGARGTAVKDLQNYLKLAGHYKGNPTSIYDNATKNAVTQFQKKYKLKVDGMAGPQTVAKLNSVLGAKTTATTTSAKTITSATKSININQTLKAGSKGTSVTLLQEKLKKANLYKGKVNGVYDSATKSAVISFQKKNKLKADGIAGKNTLQKINSVVK